LLRSTDSREQVREFLDRQYDYWCKVGIEDTESIDSFVGYMARYLRRPPIANRNIISFDNGTVVFMGKDTRAGELRRMEVSAKVFLSRLSNQVSEPYTNGVHYFGLIAPAAKRRGYRTFMGLLGQEIPKPIKRMTWRGCMIQEFGIDPLLDSNGEIMHWERNVFPGKT
jgi:Putative transposase